MNCIFFEPITRQVYCSEEMSIAEIARNAGVSVVSSCGSQGTCGKCKIRILSGRVSPPTDKEIDKIGAEDIANGYRLACLARVYEDVTVEVPAETLVDSHQLQVAGKGKTVALEPVVRQYNISLLPPDMLDQRSDQRAVLDYIKKEYGLKEIDFDLSAKRTLSDILRKYEWQAGLVLRNREIIKAGNPEERMLGLAVDLGTTKIAAYLADLQTGEILAAKGVINQQTTNGDDLMVRLAYAMEKDEKPLRIGATEDINKLIADLCSETNFDNKMIVEAVVVGNTAMHHLFLGLPVRQLALVPYIPAISTSVDIKARDLGLNIAPGAYIHLLPNIAGFVGADHVAVIIATEIYNTKKVSIAIDIGTNTEITLSAHGKLFSTSCASGPAFEGAHIKDGMRAFNGAIEKIKITNSTVECKTIKNDQAIGICGSGILDAVAQLRKAGVINRTGKI